MAAGTVTVYRTTFLEDDVVDGAYSIDGYDDFTTTVYDADDAAHAARIIAREGLTFAATGRDWAANPDGTTIVDYATGRREERTAELSGFTAADTAAIIAQVG